MSFTIAPTRLFARSSKPVAASWRCSFSSTSRDQGLPPTLPMHERLSALSPKPLPAMSPSPLELLASQPSHYITCLLMGRRYTLTPNDVLTVPKLKSVRAGQRIALTRILEVGSRDYTLRAGPSPSSLPPRPTSAVSAKLSSFQPSTPLLRPPMARTIIDASGVPRDWQRHPDSLPHFKDGEVKAEVLVLEHVKGKLFEVEKFKRRKGYRRTLRSKLEFTKLRVGDIILGAGEGSASGSLEGETPKMLDTELEVEGERVPLPTALRPIVICGPSGTGKSTLLQLLFKDYPDKFGFSISHTTRPPRAGETDGLSYHFTTREKFLALVQQGGFIEHAEFSGNMYGTSVSAVQAVAKEGNKTCILDIDTQGVKLIKANHPTLNPLYVFISPPSLSSLRTRLTGRGTESEVSLSARLSAAVGEVQYAQTGAFDVVIINDDLQAAYERLKKVVVEGDLTAGDRLPSFKE